jgi:endonuclease/exonuclease/phosphatase family metal-dependent hydrolase
VIRAVNPDILAIQEAPSRKEELALYIQSHLSDGGAPRYQFFLGDSGGAQKLGLLYKPGAVDSAQLAPHEDIANLIDAWEADVNGDAYVDLYTFTRTPLVVNLSVGGQKLQIIVAHTKSNFINNGQQMWENPTTRQNYIVGALQNRRRISTEAMRIRTYLDAILKNDAEARIIVLGDLNDGPGRDYFEEKYLSHNVTDILVGTTFEPEKIFAHAQHDVSETLRYTATFDDFVTGEVGKELLLDHVLLSPGLRHRTGLRKVPRSGTIHHAEYKAQLVNNGLNREDRSSDHTPVSVRLEY